MSIEVFVGAGAEEGFKAWRQSHPYGYFLNSNDPPEPGYIVLHKAACTSVDSGHQTTYRKTCGNNRTEIREWMLREGFDPVQVRCGCPICDPTPL